LQGKLSVGTIAVFVEDAGQASIPGSSRRAGNAEALIDPVYQHRCLLARLPRIAMEIQAEAPPVPTTERISYLWQTTCPGLNINSERYL
jgi:hypothetical protein